MFDLKLPLVIVAVPEEYKPPPVEFAPVNLLFEKVVFEITITPALSTPAPLVAAELPVTVEPEIFISPLIVFCNTELVPELKFDETALKTFELVIIDEVPPSAAF